MEINKQRSTVRSSASEAIIDQGLRSYMLKVYNYMASGVLLTGFVALMFFKIAVVTSAEGQIIGLTNFGNTIYASGLKWVIMPLLGCATSVIIMIGFLGLIGWKVTVISSNFIALMLILNMAMNIHVTVRFLQLKKEFLQIVLLVMMQDKQEQFSFNFFLLY